MNTKLPQVINTPYGLRDKLTDLYRDNLSHQDKMISYYKVEDNRGIFYNRKTLENLAVYTQIKYNTYKLITK